MKKLDLRQPQSCFFPNCNFCLLALAMLLVVMGCATIVPSPTQAPVKKEPVTIEKLPPLVPIEPEEFPLFGDSYNYDNLAYCIKNSLTYLARRSPDDLVYFGKDPYTISHLTRSLTYFSKIIREKPSPSRLSRIIADKFRVYRSTGKDGNAEVMFTGYYEPLLMGSPVKTKEFPYPVYGLPHDLISIDLSKFSKALSGKRIQGRYNGKTVVPYYSRHQIETDPNFARKAKPIAWVNDRVDLFFLHIQGSGRIQLTNGQTINVHYHGVNGRPYRSIGKLLIDQGKISREEMSMQKIREYLKEYPNQLDSILRHNSSYVFFKIEEKGTLGCFGVPLTPARSAAFDRNAFPPAALAFIKTEIPMVNAELKIEKWSKHKGFVLNQDTGGAIKGPGRVDLFWGSGPYAEIAAGHLKNQGELYFLILNPQSI